MCRNVVLAMKLLFEQVVLENASASPTACDLHHLYQDCPKDRTTSVACTNCYFFSRGMLTLSGFPGCCPTEAEIQEVLLATENKEATGTVQLEDFLPYMCKEITEHRFAPASAEMLLTAFRFFDEEKKGFLSKEQMTQLMMEEGEPFTQEEFDEMMQTALDPVTDTIPYEFYINQLMVEDDIQQDKADIQQK